MTTLYDIVLAVSSFLLPMHRGKSTAQGTTATLIDTVRKAQDDQFNNGVLFFESGTYASTFEAVTDYVNSTGTFTFSPVKAGNVAADTLYAAFALRAGANVYDIIGAINQALFEVGDCRQENTTLVTVDEQEEYTLPSGVSNVRQLLIARETSAPYKWWVHNHWLEVGSELHIPHQYSQLDDDYPMKLVYYAPHATLDSDDDTISTQINKQWLIYAAAINLIRSLAQRGINWEPYQVEYEEAQQKVVTMRPKLSTGSTPLIRFA